MITESDHRNGKVCKICLKSMRTHYCIWHVGTIYFDGCFICFARLRMEMLKKEALDINFRCRETENVQAWEVGEDEEIENPGPERPHSSYCRPDDCQCGKDAPRAPRPNGVDLDDKVRDISRTIKII